MSTLRVFNHYVRVEFLLLGIAQFGLLIFCVYAAAILRFAGDSVPLTQDMQFVLPKALIFAVVLIVAMVSMGLYRPQRENRYIPLMVRVGAGFLFAIFTLSIVYYLFPEFYLGRGVLAIAFGLGLPCLLVTQLLFYIGVDQRASPWRVMFYGAGKNAEEILSFMRRRSDFASFQLVACVPAPGEVVRVRSDLLKPSESSLLEFARRYRIDEIVVTMDDRRSSFPADQLIDCRIAGVNVIDTLTFYERQTGKIKTSLLNPSWIIFSYGFRHTPIQASLKRALDVSASVVLLLLSWPVMVIVAIAIWLEDGRRASILYRQSRVGLHGRTFEIFKFRSMGMDAEASGARWASENDPRVTRVGGFLRKYRLDELPQLFNVLSGEMSLVGPRPERPEFVDTLAENLPYYRVRECVKPGITGWAQLGYPYGASEEDARGKLALDLYYVKNRSLFLDFLILIGTCEVVLFRKGGR